MRNMCAGLAIALTALSGAVNAGDAAKEKRQEIRSAENEVVDRAKLRAALDAELASLDLDKDGKLDHGEKRKALKALREKLDKKDGDVNGRELKKLREKHPELHDRLVHRMNESREEKREAYVDRRQEHQEHRIDQGVKKGYLTPSETQKLQTMEKHIEDAEASFKSDGKLSKPEMKQLRDMLDQASVQIWAEKHDTEGNQMATLRYGKNVFAKNDFTARLENENLTGEQARQWMKEFRQASAMKRRLANEALTSAERELLQAQYNTFLNLYFEVR